LRDAVELEWAGVPSVAIVHEEMRGSAQAIARVSGCPDYEFLAADYPWTPTAIWSKEECLELAEIMAPKVLAALTGQN